MLFREDTNKKYCTFRKSLSRLIQIIHYLLSTREESGYCMLERLNILYIWSFFLVIRVNIRNRTPCRKSSILLMLHWVQSVCTQTALRYWAYGRDRTFSSNDFRVSSIRSIYLSFFLKNFFCIPYNVYSVCWYNEQINLRVFPVIRTETEHSLRTISEYLVFARYIWVSFWRISSAFPITYTVCVDITSKSISGFFQ